MQGQLPNQLAEFGLFDLKFLRDWIIARSVMAGALKSMGQIDRKWLAAMGALDHHSVSREFPGQTRQGYTFQIFSAAIFRVTIFENNYFTRA